MAFPFRGVDFMRFDASLSAGELETRARARQFVEERVTPIIEQCNRDGRFPRELVEPLGALGFLGANLEGYGCAGMSNVAYGLVMQELERGDSAIRSFVSVQSALAMYAIHAFGSEAQKRDWLPGMASGEKLGCFALTEPQFGSNPSGMETRARKEGGDYVLKGEKRWVTSGSIADVAVVWAKADDDGGRIRGFLLEPDRPGLTAREIRDKWSLRASVSSALTLENVRIPVAHLLEGSGGLKSPLLCLNQARYGIAWGAIGAAMECYDTALQYALARKQFHDQPIACHQLVQEKLVWMLSEITKAQLLTLHLGRLKDLGQAGFEHISMAKRNNVWMALECARMARDILGANGITGDYPVMRHMMNLESVKTYEGTHDIHALILGENITGIAAY